MSLLAAVARQLRCARPLLKSSLPLSTFRHVKSKLHTMAESLPRKTASVSTKTYQIVGIASMALAVATFNTPTVKLDVPQYNPPPRVQPMDPLPPAPESMLNLYEMSFGTICGLCAGVFCVKGAKAIAFALGGVFVLLQYFGSASVLRVDWAKMGNRFENLFFTTDKTTGTKNPPSVYSLYVWVVEFLTANFQQRASFLAGFALGIRVG